MASQQIPVSYQPLVKLLAQAADGARSHGAAVGLKQNIEAVLRPELEAIIGPSGSNQGPPATPSLKARWNAAKAYKVDASSRLLVAKADGRGLALACVNALKARLGLRWSNVWQAAGFTAGSLRVPEDPLTTLQQLRDYFTTHPDHELPNLSPVFGATAASCHAAAEAIIAATTELNEKTVAASDAKTQLDDALRSARQRLGGLREELSRLLAHDDQRWYHFGFDRPSDPQVPEVPEGLRLALGATGSGSLFVEWEGARRAENYRVVVRDLAGHEVIERLTSETELTLNGLASGQTVQIVITARNGRGGESAPAVALMATVP